MRFVGAADTVGEWLDVLEKLMELPSGERADVRAELDGHMRERVRDLMLSGRSEDEAVKTAISEIGDAAVLARSLARNHPSRTYIFRRHAMNIAAVVAVSAAVVTGVFSIRSGAIGNRVVSGNPPAGQSVAVDPPANDGAGPGTVYLRLVDTYYMPRTLSDVRISCTPTTTWQKLFDDIGTEIGRPLHVQWAKLGNVGGEPIQPDSAVGVSLDNVALPEALGILNELHGVDEEDGITILVRDRWVMATTISQADKMERVEKVRSISDLVEVTALEMDMSRAEARAQVVPQVQKLIETMITPTLWTSNGGDRAMMNAYNDTLYYAAPARVVQKVEALLETLLTQARADKAHLSDARHSDDMRQQKLLRVMEEDQRRAAVEQLQALREEDAARGAEMKVQQGEAKADQLRAAVEQAATERRGVMRQKAAQADLELREKKPDPAMAPK